MKSIATLVSALLAIYGSAVEAALTLGLGRSADTTRLPKPLSDVTASLGDNGLIYISGGRDSSFGNQWDAERNSFICSSVSDSFYAFDPVTDEFITLPDMPGPRHRHAAVMINNQLWLVGGRDEFDKTVGSVDVYDIDVGRWRRFDDLYYKYWVSDLGGFKASDRAFFVGGFTEDYRALARVFSIDPIASWEEGTLQILRHRNLIHRRGDVGVTVDAEETFAYVSGGSTDANSFCTPLNSVERYNLTTREWIEMAPLQQGRAGKTVIEIENQLVALGGAQQIGKMCKQNASNPSDMQTPVYEIEAYDDGIGRWDIIDNLSDYRFRSTSVVYNDKVYSFGGQTRYFSQCMCHPTVDDVRIYNEDSPDGVYAGSDMINEWQPNFGEKEAPEEDPLIVNGEYQYDSLRANSGSTSQSTTMSAVATVSICMFTVAFL